MRTPLLELRSVSHRFGGLQAVRGLNLVVESGEVLALLGPNGSGKTTALNLISGALACQSGDLLLQGRRITGLPAHRRARLGIARSFQLVRLLGAMTCSENVEAGMAFTSSRLFGPRARRQAQGWLEQMGLAAQADTPAAQLTYIDQKRLELARALAQQPRLLLLDEWLAGLNPSELQTGIGLLRGLSERGLTLILVEHVMSAVHALCQRTVVMQEGRKIADGPTASVLRDPQVVLAYLGDARLAEPGPRKAPHA